MPGVATAFRLSTTTATTSATNAEIWVAWNQSYIVPSGQSGGGASTLLTTDNAVQGTTGTLMTGTDVGGGGSTSATIWVNWNRTYTGTSSVTSPTIDVEGATVRVVDPWGAWNSEYTVNAVRISDEEFQARVRQQQADARERAARWEAERPAREARQRAELAESEAAKQRAALILRESLTPEQQAELAEKNYFTIRSIRPNGEERHYRIHRGRSHNVERVDASGRKIRRYCMHPIVNCPDEDTMLTQKLWLQNPDLEDEFLRRANQS